MSCNVIIHCHNAYNQLRLKYILDLHGCHIPLFHGTLFCCTLFCCSLFCCSLFCCTLFCCTLFCCSLFCCTLFCCTLFCCTLFFFAEGNTNAKIRAYYKPVSVISTCFKINNSIVHILYTYICF